MDGPKNKKVLYVPKKKFLGRCQYQNKKALFTDSIFSEGFASNDRPWTSIQTDIQARAYLV